jgi:hypothetical protein
MPYVIHLNPIVVNTTDFRLFFDNMYEIRRLNKSGNLMTKMTEGWNTHSKTYERTHYFYRFVRFQVLTTVMNSSVFWDVMPCSPVKVIRLFGKTYRLHLQG